MPKKRFPIMFGTEVTSDEKELVSHNLTETVQVFVLATAQKTELNLCLKPLKTVPSPFLVCA